MTTETYKGFLITYESLADDAIAYRNDNFYRSSIPTYKGTVEEIKSEIDEKQDLGDFTLEQIAFMVIEQNPLNDAMIARLFFAAQNKTSDLSRKLTPEELSDLVVRVTGWGVDTEDEAVLNAEAFSVLQDEFLLNDVSHTTGLSATPGMRTMYHTVHYDKWESIRVGGLTPGTLLPSAQEVTGYSEGVYLEEDKEGAYGWASMLAGWYLPESDEIVVVKFVVLVVQIPKGSVLTPDPDVYDIGQEQPTAFIYQHRIPPEHIKLADVTEVEIG